MYRLIVCGAAVALLPRGGAAAEPTVDFNRDVRPILTDKCFACHGPDEKQRKKKLRLDVREDALAAEAFVPGKPDESPLVARVLAEGREQMPPARSGKKLTPKEVETLRKWVGEGAKYAPQWAYVPPRQHEVPGTKHQTHNFIDNFLFAR
ncbi:MAG: c-type cytochrome domain-containing protein, partial [Gemmata sp.]